MSTEPTNADEARRAKERAERKLASQRAKTGVIDRLVDSLRGMSEENHFSSRLRDLYRGET